jgi:hypothetical protein
MPGENLFTMLSSYRQGASASPFENYCTSGLAYFLQQGHAGLTRLFCEAAGLPTSEVILAEVQPMLGGAGIADLVLTLQGGQRILVETEVEPGTDPELLASLEEHARYWPERPALLMVTLPTTVPPPGWCGVSWLQVAEALEQNPVSVEWEFAEFVMRDILGLGPVPLDQAIASNRLYALGGAAVRKRFGERVRYVNSASRPVGGRYRYLGTTFALDGGEMEFWIGLVNESIPLSEHYYLMLASKRVPLAEPAEAPRATGDWKWPYWTGSGRVVRPITMESYMTLLDRLAVDEPQA